MTNWMPDRRLLGVGFLVDTNCVNARQKIEAMNELEGWAADDLIELITSEVAQKEALAGNNGLRAAKAYSFIFTESAITTNDERKFMQQIEQIVFPGGAANENQRNDVEIVFNAAKYMRTLVTHDGGSKSQPGGILGHRDELRELGIKIMTPAEAVAQVRKEIELRDRSAHQMAELGAAPLPDWVGKD
jgi:hypothetical protein